MPTPSLILVPARFKSGKMYSQIPTSGAGDFTVTRATTATRVNASGLIESVASGIPRLDYFASGGVVGCPALLVEPSGSNLAFHSETWASGNNWDLANGVTIATGSTSAFLAPDGTFTANAISPTSGITSHFTGSNNTTRVTYTSGTIYTQSAFFKAGTGAAGQFVQMTTWVTPNNQNGFANFDLQNGLVTLVSGATADANRSARIQNYGNGWYRCSLTVTATGSGTERGVRPVLITASGDIRTPSFAGTVTDVLYGWGAQLETGSVATSYIPTTTGSVTRNADVINLSGAVSGCIGQTEGTIYAEVDYRNFSNITMLSVQTASIVSGAVRIETTANGTQLRCHIRDVSGTMIIDQTVSSPLLSTGINKIAVGYSSAASGLCIALNGSVVFTGTAAASFTINPDRIYLGAREQAGAGTNFFNNRIRSVALYTTRLTNAQLASLTT